MKRTVAEPYRDVDFSRAKRGAVIKAEPGKTKISIRLDNRVVEHFRELVEEAGSGNYQTLINETLRRGLQADTAKAELREAIREVIREEIRAECPHVSLLDSIG